MNLILILEVRRAVFSENDKYTGISIFNNYYKSIIEKKYKYIIIVIKIIFFTTNCNTLIN